MGMSKEERRKRQNERKKERRRTDPVFREKERLAHQRYRQKHLEACKERD